MTLERIRIKHLSLAEMLDKSKLFEIALGSWFFYICTSMLLWFLQLEAPTSNQEIVMMQSISLIAAATAVVQQMTGKPTAINLKKIEREIRRKIKGK